ncbi:hypothetical protein [Anaeromyxobacter diazotrophicus]|uniref:Glycosyltransferase RgtA/B/C/D-like domain-containing protein n=1 Tax=Anaeromyxobacter diazotrophicus TaxID=2590199 RepID=A0A7I9VJK3_9BACT|nr:hypothetical protein [Anaeromyxobacter diazotrophicus]GEJ56157.1 hypothetical protein AMYX_08980 [Anaeromyxobacter diazotrophicus]
MPPLTPTAPRLPQLEPAVPAAAPRHRAALAFGLLALLLLLRTGYGLVSEFWFEDELQVYLLGLKYATTGAWPYFGPDVVYTRSQIPGALQALLVGLPLRWLRLPEAPCLALNLLSFAALAALAARATRWFPGLPRWFVWGWALTCPWTLVYGTRVVNPSYVLPFAVLFFVPLLDTLPVFPGPRLRPGLAFALQGLATTCILQLHLSWVLLPPFTAAALLLAWREAGPRAAVSRAASWAAGAAAGAALLVPTFLRYGASGTGGVEHNVALHPRALLELPALVQRFVSFGAFEVPYMLGGDRAQRVAVLAAHPWVIPFAAALFAAFLLQVALYVLSLLRRGAAAWTRLRDLVLACLALLAAGFLFSVKGPSSHTFYVLFPVALLWSFACLQRALAARARLRVALALLLACGAVFHAALALEHYRHRSLYRDRDRVVRALEARDHRLLGTRRAEAWGRGY